MGNYRFRFSDMMPNAWFYKLKDMGRTRKHHASHSVRKKQSSTTSASQKSYNSRPRYSYIFTSEPGRADKLYNSPKHPKASDTNFPDPSRKSSKRRTGRKTIDKPSPILVPSSVSAGCSSHATLKSVWTESSPTQDSSDYSFSPLESSPEPNLPESLLSESEDDDFAPPRSFDRPASPLSSGNCKISSSTADIIIDMNDDPCKREFEKVAGFHAISDLVLPPILTKPAELKDTSREIYEFRRTANRSFSVKVVKEESGRTQKEPKAFSPSRKSFVSSAGIKLRANSPKIASKKIQAHARKSVSSNTCSRSRNKSISESFAVVKSSVDPQRDFRDSMVEMIVENNIRTSKDLEDLLACYLSLNSNEYHNIIVKAFEQIWFDMTNLHL